MTVTKYILKKPLALAVSSILLSASAFAGQIITDAPEGVALQTATSTLDAQFGFGGWNLENVEVNIVNVSDFSTPIAKSFDEASGTYTNMVADESFESVISTVAGEARGNLHGKDWPVGEPSGIKVINGDLKTKHGKPANCIMTSSYLDTGYLDTNAGAGNPTVCSSPFQSHKRFKINILPTTVANVAAATSGDGLPVDITFNLVDGDTSTQRYQVLQKLNNYTGKRLDGYKIEVLDHTGAPNAALTLSLGAGEDDTDPLNLGADIWDIEDLANFSHGLWGPIDGNFDTNGFFDSTRAYYPAALAIGNQSISYSGDMAGGNYQTVFGNWLPSDWAPLGIFHDDDEDPATDGVLKAFWGDPLNTGTDSWHKGNEEGWAAPSDAELLAWEGDWYSRDHIEDVLNLGLNYIVNVGDNAAIGDTFTIRITPHVAADQAAPTYVANPAPAPVEPEEPTVPSTSSSSSFDAYNSQSFFIMFFGFIGIGLLMARRRLGK